MEYNLMSVEQKREYINKVKFRRLNWTSKEKEKVAENIKNSRRLRLYGITTEQYNIMFKKQNGKCKMCKRHQSKFKNELSVDHNHSTGKVRGLLCNACNRLIGRIENNLIFFKTALKYITD